MVVTVKGKLAAHQSQEYGRSGPRLTRSPAQAVNVLGAFAVADCSYLNDRRPEHTAPVSVVHKAQNRVGQGRKMPKWEERYKKDILEDGGDCLLRWGGGVDCDAP